MSDERCVHELLPGQCATCTGRDGGVAAEKARLRALLDVRGVVRAGFPGRCGRCGEAYGVGVPIRALPASMQDGTVWVAACCLDEHGKIALVKGAGIGG